MRKILIINTIGLNYEGITTVIMNYTSNMKREELELVFIAFENCKSELKATFEQIGEVIILPNRKRNPILYVKSLMDVVRSSHYDMVHIHGNSGTMALETVVCHFGGIKDVLVHCHSTNCNHQILNCVLKLPMKKLATRLIACSDSAGKWLYGSDQFCVLNNAIDTDKFLFSESDRTLIRNELGLVSDEFVIGHSGHFSEVKNQDFLIDVLEALNRKGTNVKLLLVSDGPRFNLIKSKVKQMHLENSVVFIGRTDKPEKYYQAMDMFAFPSKWEGLGLVLVEAQCSGLPCIASTGVPKKANVSDTVTYLDLDIELWCNEILGIIKTRSCRKENSKRNIVKIKQKGFDIKKEAHKLEKIYRNN